MFIKTKVTLRRAEAGQPAAELVTKPAASCHYFPLGEQLPSLPQSWYQIILLHDGEPHVGSGAVRIGPTLFHDRRS